MQLKDRDVLAKLMILRRVSNRELARAAGWKAHSYIGRLLRGEVTTLRPDPAVRIAEYLDVKVDDLFVPRSSNVAGSRHSRKTPAA